MKTVASWNDLEKFGVIPLTGEACGLSYRLLCDFTAKGKAIVQKCLGLDEGFALEPWNRGSLSDPHVGSIMLAPAMLVPLGVFALLESGCSEVWLCRNGSLLGVEPDDPPEQIKLSRQMCSESLVRTFAYRGTAGDRNVHVMSGRVT